MPFLYQPNTAELVVYEQGGPRQARRTVSANDPQITAMFPNGGETITQPITATWQAADSDGDTLTYIVLYSADNGVHWQPLITGLKTPSFVLDPATLPGSDQARLRIVASDGIRTIHRDSHASFIVPTKPPRAHILTPRNESQTRAGEAVTFFARGFDQEDGVIRDDAAFTWHSSLDGPLGAGRSLELATLAPGRHTITLVLTDSDGDIGRDSIALTVVSPAPPLARAMNSCVMAASSKVI